MKSLLINSLMYWACSRAILRASYSANDAVAVVSHMVSFAVPVVLADVDEVEGEREDEDELKLGSFVALCLMLFRKGSTEGQSMNIVLLYRQFIHEGMPLGSDESF